MLGEKEMLEFFTVELLKNARKSYQKIRSIDGAVLVSEQVDRSSGKIGGNKKRFQY